MSRFFVTLTPRGRAVDFLELQQLEDPDAPGVEPPAGSVELTEEAWRAWRADPPHFRWDGAAPQPAPAPDECFFAVIDTDGRARAFYVEAVHEEIPETAIAISAEIWRAWAADTARQRWDGTALVPYGPPAPEAAPYEVPKLAVIDRLVAAGLLRSARAALKLGRPDDELSDAELALRDRWDAATAIRSDDAEVRVFLAAIGADPDIILAKP